MITEEKLNRIVALMDQTIVAKVALLAELARAATTASHPSEKLANTIIVKLLEIDIDQLRRIRNDLAS